MKKRSFFSPLNLFKNIIFLILKCNFLYIQDFSKWNYSLNIFLLYFKKNYFKKFFVKRKMS